MLRSFHVRDMTDPQYGVAFLSLKDADFAVIELACGVLAGTNAAALCYFLVDALLRRKARRLVPDASDAFEKDEWRRLRPNNKVAGCRPWPWIHGRQLVSFLHIFSLLGGAVMLLLLRFTAAIDLLTAGGLTVCVLAMLRFRLANFDLKLAPFRPEAVTETAAAASARAHHWRCAFGGWVVVATTAFSLALNTQERGVAFWPARLALVANVVFVGIVASDAPLSSRRFRLVFAALLGAEVLSLACSRAEMASMEQQVKQQPVGFLIACFAGLWALDCAAWLRINAVAPALMARRAALRRKLLRLTDEMSMRVVSIANAKQCYVWVLALATQAPSPLELLALLEVLHAFKSSVVWYRLLEVVPSARRRRLLRTCLFALTVLAIGLDVGAKVTNYHKPELARAESVNDRHGLSRDETLWEGWQSQDTAFTCVLLLLGFVEVCATALLSVAGAIAGDERSGTSGDLAAPLNAAAESNDETAVEEATTAVAEPSPELEPATASAVASDPEPDLPPPRNAQAAASLEPLEDWLELRVGWLGVWTPRYLRLLPRDAMIGVYGGKGAGSAQRSRRAPAGAPIEILALDANVRVIPDEQERTGMWGFALKTTSRTLVLRTESEEERTRWVDAFRAAVAAVAAAEAESVAGSGASVADPVFKASWWRRRYVRTEESLRRLMRERKAVLAQATVGVLLVVLPLAFFLATLEWVDAEHARSSRALPATPRGAITKLAAGMSTPMGTACGGDSVLVFNFTPCSLDGVECKDDSPVTLGLQQQDFVGTVATELGWFDGLEGLDLGGNGALSGTLPTQLGQLTALVTLSLGGSAVSGQLPTQLGRLSVLRSLKAWPGKLSSTLPAQLTKLKDISECDLPFGPFCGGPGVNWTHDSWSVLRCPLHCAARKDGFTPPPWTGCDGTAVLGIGRPQGVGGWSDHSVPRCASPPPSPV